MHIAARTNMTLPFYTPERVSRGRAMTNQWNAAEYDAKHAFVYERAKGLVELLAPKPSERILDLGCGTGALTAEIATRGAEVLGVDRSEEMITQAKRKFPALQFEVVDARELRVKLGQVAARSWAGTASKVDGAGEIDKADVVEEAPEVGWLGFDAVFSNAVLHWIPEAEEVIAGVAQVLKPGPRFSNRARAGWRTGFACSGRPSSTTWAKRRRSDGFAKWSGSAGASNFTTAAGCWTIGDCGSRPGRREAEVVSCRLCVVGQR